MWAFPSKFRQEIKVGQKRIKKKKGKTTRSNDVEFEMTMGKDSWFK